MAHKLLVDNLENTRNVVRSLFLKRYGITFNLGEYDLFLGVEGSKRNSRVKKIGNSATFMPSN